MSVYTHQNLVKVFAELKNNVGKYDPTQWHCSMPQMPIGIDDDTKEQIYQEILNTTNKHFLKRKPKSWQSLAMQVAVCLSTHELSELEQATIETRGRNRMAAYAAGFLTMMDIIHLEQSEGVK